MNIAETLGRGEKMNYVNVECLIGQPGEAKVIAVPVKMLYHPDIRRDSSGVFAWQCASKLLSEIPGSFVPR